MSHEHIGIVSHYYDHLHVAVLALDEEIHVGDWLHLCGHTTDFVQPVLSLQIDHAAVQSAAPGEDVALKVIDRVRAHDVVYRITIEEARDFESERALDRAY
jgi:putative protease